LIVALRSDRFRSIPPSAAARLACPGHCWALPQPRGRAHYGGAMRALAAGHAQTKTGRSVLVDLMGAARWHRPAL